MQCNWTPLIVTILFVLCFKLCVKNNKLHPVVCRGTRVDVAVVAFPSLLYNMLQYRMCMFSDSHFRSCSFVS